MKEFKLNIEMDNDAFRDYPSNELSRILEELAQTIWNRGIYFLIRSGQTLIYDINGNKIGQFSMEDTK